MRCFESFFKRTWRPQQVHEMDSSRRLEPTKKTAEMRHQAADETTELGDVIVSSGDGGGVATSAASTHPGGSDATAAPCKNGGCKVWQNSRVPGVGGDEPRSESPWHSLKTIFLVSVIVAFLLWVVVYTLLDQYRIL